MYRFPFEIQEEYNLSLFYIGLICVGAGTVLGVIYGALVRVYTTATSPADEYALPLLSSTAAAASTADPGEEVVPLVYFAVPFLCVVAGTFVAYVLTWTGVYSVLAGAGSHLLNHHFAYRMHLKA